MSIALRAAQGSNNAGGGPSITMTKPTGTVDGDVMAMNVTVRGGTGTTIDTSSAFAQQTVPGSTLGGYYVTYGDDGWVAAFAGGVLTSPDGVTWTKQTVTGLNGDGGVAFGSGMYVACGSATIKLASSPDGVTWTTRTSSLGTHNLTAAAYGNNQFAIGSENGEIATSPDGITWTSQGTIFSAGNQCFGLAYSDTQSQWVAVGNNDELYTSPDAVTWTSQTSSFSGDSISCVTFGNGVWVAGSSTGKIASSTNGTSWTQRTSTFGTNNIRAVAYGNGLFIAVGTNGSMSTSPDGTNWTSRTSSFGGTDSVNGIFWASNLWVACGFNGSTTAVEIGISRTWTKLGTEVTSGTTLIQGLYWRVAKGEPASYVVTITSNKASGVIIALSGADLGTPISSQYAGQANGSSATVTAPSIGTWPAVNGIDLFFGGTATGTTATAPTNYTEPTNGESASTGGGGSSRTTSGVAYRALSATASVGSLTATYGAAAVNIGHHVFIEELPVPPNPHVNPYVQIIR